MLVMWFICFSFCLVDVLYFDRVGFCGWRRQACGRVSVPKAANQGNGTRDNGHGCQQGLLLLL